MTARLLTLTLFVCVAITAFADDDTNPAPQSFLEYLKPGTHIGVQSLGGTTDVVIHVYTDSDFETAATIAENKSVRLASEAAESNAAVREELTAYIKRRKLSESDARTIRLMPLRASLATVRVIGGDFILVELSGDTKRRKVIPKSRVGAIYLDASPVNFFASPRGGVDRSGN